MIKFFLFVFITLAALPTHLAWSANRIKNYPFVNQEGKPFQLDDLKGKYVFVSFIFTRCPLPKMCPLTVTRNKELLRQWKSAKAKNKTAKELQLLFVTLDPDFDTASVLKSFATKRQLDLKHTLLATGNPQSLSEFAAEFNVMGMPMGGTISHNMKSILLNSELTEVKQYKDNEWTAAEVVSDIMSSPKL